MSRTTVRERLGTAAHRTRHAALGRHDELWTALRDVAERCATRAHAAAVVPPPRRAAKAGGVAGMLRLARRGPAGAVVAARRAVTRQVGGILRPVLALALVLWLLWHFIVGPIVKPVWGALDWIIPGSYGCAGQVQPAVIPPEAGADGDPVGLAWQAGQGVRDAAGSPPDGDSIAEAFRGGARLAGRMVAGLQAGLRGEDPPAGTVPEVVQVDTPSCTPGCGGTTAPGTLPAGQAVATPGLPLVTARAVLASDWSTVSEQAKVTVIAVADAESSDDPQAVNPQQVRIGGELHRAHGLLQLMLPLHADLLDGQWSDPVANLNAGLRLHRQQGWQAWDVYRSGAYLERIDGARQALALARQGSVVTTAVCGPTVTASAEPQIEAAVQWALAQQGKPYLWGATPMPAPTGPVPPAFDCSSLVDSAFLAAGIDLPGRATTATLIEMGQPVPAADVRRGDVVFPDRGHVGIALGDGSYVHAPRSGDVVKVSPLDRPWQTRRMAVTVSA